MFKSIKFTYRDKKDRKKNHLICKSSFFNYMLFVLYKKHKIHNIYRFTDHYSIYCDYYYRNTYLMHYILKRKRKIKVNLFFKKLDNYILYSIYILFLFNVL